MDYKWRNSSERVAFAAWKHPECRISELMQFSGAMYSDVKRAITAGYIETTEDVIPRLLITEKGMRSFR